MLELAILGLLTEQELHGYELKKRLADTSGFGGGVSFGSLYPALGRLERAGAVKAVEARAVAPVPATGSLGGELAAHRARRTAARGTRGKKVYGITPRGAELFEELLSAGADSAGDDRLFNLRLVFARHLRPDARLGMLERRRLHLLDRLARIRSRVRAGVDRWDAYGHSIVEHDREATEHDISWIEQLIAHERAATPPSATPPSATPPSATPPSATPPSATPPSDAPSVGATPGDTPTTELPPPSSPHRADRPSLSGLRDAGPRAAHQEDLQ